MPGLGFSRGVLVLLLGVLPLLGLGVLLIALLVALVLHLLGGLLLVLLVSTVLGSDGDSHGDNEGNGELHFYCCDPTRLEGVEEEEQWGVGQTEKN